MHSTDDVAWKVVLCGDAEVGKSQLVNRIVHDAFEARYAPSEVDFTYKRYSAVKLQLWDVAGYLPHSIMPLYFRGSHVIMIVYDVADPTSVEGFSARYGHATNSRSPCGPFVVVLGNKADLLPDGGASLMTDAALQQGALPADAVADSTAAVQAADAFCIEKELPHYVVSAKTGERVDSVIRQVMVRTLREQGFPTAARKGGVRLPVR